MSAGVLLRAPLWPAWLGLRALRRLTRLAYRNQNLLLVLTALGTMSALAAVSGYWLFYRAAYVLGALVPLCFVWARLHLRGLQVKVERSQDRLQVGQEAEARVHLRSTSGITKLWLELEDLTDMPGGSPRTVVTLPARSSRNWKVKLTCRRRGLFTVGPLRITTGDPFGLFRLERTYGQACPLLVLPQPEELPYFALPAAQLPGEGTVRQRTHYVTPNASGIREYYPGDSYNRIHWPTTARLGRLAVKTFEMDPSSNVWIVLDLQGTVHAGVSDESSEEYGVRIAASLAWHFLRENSMLALLASGARPVILEPARGIQQYTRILETLAAVHADGSVPLEEVLEKESRRFGRHSTVIVVTPSVSEDWVFALGALGHQGARTACVLLDPATFGAKDRGPLPQRALVAAGVTGYVVSCGDDIGLMLGPAGLMGAQPLGRTGVGVA